MIQGFQQPRWVEPVKSGHLQWFPAIAAGFIAGVILLILPHASPWEGLSAFTPTIIGRSVPPSWGMAAFAIIVIHLGLSIVYGVIISLVVARRREPGATLLGGLFGLVLYCLNLGIVSVWFPALKGTEVSVIVTHLLFGLVGAGAYRGLLRRKVPAGA